MRAFGRVAVALVLASCSAVAFVTVLFSPAGKLLPPADIAMLVAAACVAFAAVALLPELWVLGAPAVGAGLALVAGATGTVDVPSDAGIQDAQGGIGIAVVGAAQYAILLAGLVARGTIKLN